MRMFLLLIPFILFANNGSVEAELVKVPKKSIWNSKNIWIKTYVNNKNYYTIINNIVKIEEKLKRSKSVDSAENLRRKLDLQKSKLALYESNKSFDRLLMEYKYVATNITIYDYIYRESENNLKSLMEKLINLKNEFNLASSMINNDYKNNKNRVVWIDDIKYFEEFVENIDKTYLNLLEAKSELKKKYDDYYELRLQKHIITFVIFLITYVLYKLIVWILIRFEQKTKNEDLKNYKKLLAIFYFICIIVFIVIRYIDDFLYIVTFLSVLAAAITIALRELLLNIVGSVYIFFSNTIRVGDRIMIQFETKHTIGDIIDISLMKIKMNEIEDYTNVKEVKNIGRTIYIPNSYIFTKVFYNYSRKKNGLINDLIEFEFSIDNDFENVQRVTEEIFSSLGLDYTMTFTLNNLKTGVLAIISYQTNYKVASKVRGDVSIKLLQSYNLDETIKLKGSKTTKKSGDEDV